MTYDVLVLNCAKLSKIELRSCIAILEEGSAVDPISATEKLPEAKAVAVAKSGEIIAGVGAIKVHRPEYNATISKRSGFPIEPSALELGYVAIHKGSSPKRAFWTDP